MVSVVDYILLSFIGSEIKSNLQIEATVRPTRKLPGIVLLILFWINSCQIHFSASLLYKMKSGKTEAEIREVWQP